MANYTTGTYDPRDVNVYIEGLEADGFAEGMMINIKYVSDKNNMVGGAKGDATKVKIVSRLGEMTLRFKKNSRMHQYLIETMLVDDAASGAPMLPIVVLEGSFPLAEALFCIGKAPDEGFAGTADGRDEPIREWMLKLSNLLITA